MDTASVLAALDARITSRSILDHPFYRAWSAGTLASRDLAVYARAYYPHVAAFPGYLEAALDGAEIAAVRDELRDNLAEERGVPAPHPELWLRFAAAVGAEPAAVAAAPASPATAATVADFDRLCRTSTVAALTALYAYESQQPEVSRQKAAGLAAHYGVTDVGALSYFTVHSEADLRHRDGERRALALCLEAGADSADVLPAADAALDAYWRLLDGVMEEIGATAGVC